MRLKSGRVLITIGSLLAAFGLLWLGTSILSEVGNPPGLLAGALICFVFLAIGFALLREGQKRHKRSVAEVRAPTD